MHAILTVTGHNVIKCCGGKNYRFFSLLPLCASMLPCIVRCKYAVAFFESSNENCGLLHKWLATSPPRTACNQLTINTPFHSLRRERGTSLFCSREEEQGRNTSGQPELRAQHESSTGLPTSRLRATAHTECSSLWPWLYCPLLAPNIWIRSTPFIYFNQNRHTFPQVVN